MQAVNDGCIAFNPEDEFGRRYHSNLTNLRSELRKYLRVDGQPLVQIDISNSQPLFQAVVAEQRGVTCPAYKQVCEEGRLYEFLGEKTGLTRERTKEARGEAAPNLRVHSPALAWPSLVGLLFSRAQLRFARQEKHSPKQACVPLDTSQTRPPGNASIVVNGYQPNAPTGSRQRWDRQNP